MKIDKLSNSAHKDFVYNKLVLKLEIVRKL